MKQATEPARNNPSLGPDDFGRARLAAAKEVFSKDLTYNLNGHWGMVDTPTARDAEFVAKKLFSRYEFARPHAVFEILNHAFDNVANYSRGSTYSRGTVKVLELEDAIVLRVENRSPTALPQRLLGKAITPESGVLRLAQEERHPTETGGGNGLEGMTSWLPYIYRSDVVKTDKTGSLQFLQAKEDGEKLYSVALELHIPIPTPDEQAELLRRQAEQQKLEQHWAAAEEVLSIWKKADLQKRDTRTLEAEIATCTRALEGLANAEARRENLQFRDHTVLEALESLGTRASSAAPALRRCMLVAETTHVSETVLLKVETDLESSVRFFSENLPALVRKLAAVKDPDLRPIASIANYAKERGAAAASLQDGFLLAFESIPGQGDVASALAAIPLNQTNRARITELFRRVLSTNEDKFRIESTARILLGQPNLTDAEKNLLMDGLSSEAAYQIDEGLKKHPLGQSQIEHARSKLMEALSSDGKVELYYLSKTIEHSQGDKSVLFDPVQSMLLDTRYDYQASELLKEMNLGPDKITALMEQIGSALRERIASKASGQGEEKLYYAVQFVSEHTEEALSIRGALVDALIAGVEEYSVGQILKKTGIPPEDRPRLESELKRRKKIGGDSSYYLEEALKR